MIRMFFYVLLAFLLTLIGAWVADHPGRVVVTWSDWELHLSLAQLVFSILVFLVLLLMFQAMVLWLKREMPLIGANRHIRRQRRGLEAYNKALVQLAMGEMKEAAKLAHRAERLLPDSAMVHILKAQIAERSDDRDTLKVAFKALMKNPEARLVGLQGIGRAAARAGREDVLGRVLDEILQVDPKNIWALGKRVDQFAGEEKWSEAYDALLALKKADPKSARIKNQEPVFMAMKAYEDSLAGHHEKAEKALKQVLKMDTAFSFASLQLAKLGQQRGARQSAQKVLEAAWKANPGPDIAEAYLRLERLETAPETLRRVRHLVSKNPDHAESRYLLADWLHRAGKAEEAYDTLKPLLVDGAVTSLWRLAARVAGDPALRGRGLDRDALQSRAAEAQAFEPYLCQTCHAGSARWRPVCPACGSLNSYGRSPLVLDGTLSFGKESGVSATALLSDPSLLPAGVDYAAMDGTREED